MKYPTLRTAATAFLIAATATAALAQQKPAAAAPAAAAPVSPEKQKLIDQVLQLWHAEAPVIAKTQSYAIDAGEKADIALQGRVTTEKQKATLQAIKPDMQKYVDEATPIVQGAADRLKPTVLGPMLAQDFSEDELRQLIALLQSPIKKKFEQVEPAMQMAYGKAVVDATRPQIDPKLKTLQESVSAKLREAVMGGKSDPGLPPRTP